MYYDNQSAGSSILGTLFLSLMFYLFHQQGKREAYREVKEQSQSDEIQELRRKLDELNRQNELNRKRV